ncbi:MAG TPA: EamA family transporter [Kiloniellales bacterium]|nr:EamA family transporter [Kiloniellales bacterium]
MSQAQPRLAVELSLLGLLALLWGSSYAFTKVAVAEIPPLTLVALRVSLALPFLLVVLRLQGERLPRGRGPWSQLLVQSTLNSIVPWTLLAWGQRHVDSALASVLNSTSPIFVIFITLLVTRHERLAPRRILGACIGLAGVVLIVGVDALAGLGSAVLGQLAALGGALLYGFAAIYGRRFARLPAAAAAAGIMLWAVIFLVPASLAIDRPWTLAPSWEALAAAAGLGILCTGTALCLYFRLVRTLGSLGVASQAYLRAGVGVLLGTVLLGETVTPVVGLGLGAAVLGVALINLPSRHR